mmetsp:Transcript_141772/g.440778  ORF Transcript_141772/g.440778 Transcript_141772/m.440778 type:complete len:437 (+) Transcript_141772:31-1341(+)
MPLRPGLPIRAALYTQQITLPETHPVPPHSAGPVDGTQPLIQANSNPHIHGPVLDLRRSELLSLPVRGCHRAGLVHLEVEHAAGGPLQANAPSLLDALVLAHLSLAPGLQVEERCSVDLDARDLELVDVRVVRREAHRDHAAALEEVLDLVGHATLQHRQLQDVGVAGDGEGKLQDGNGIVRAVLEVRAPLGVVGHDRRRQGLLDELRVVDTLGATHQADGVGILTKVVRQPLVWINLLLGGHGGAGLLGRRGGRLLRSPVRPLRGALRLPCRSGLLRLHLLGKACSNLFLSIARQAEESLHVQVDLRLVRAEHLPQGLPAGKVDDGALPAIEHGVRGPEERHVLALVAAYGKIVLHVPDVPVRLLANNLVAQKRLLLPQRVRSPPAIPQASRPSHQRIPHQLHVIDGAYILVGHLAPEHPAALGTPAAGRGLGRA